MSDVQLAHVRDAGNGLDVVIIQAVPRMQVHTQVANELAGVRQCDKLLVLRRSASQGILASMQLDSLNAELPGELNLPRIGIEKQADRNPGSAQLLNGFGGGCPVSDDIQAAFSGYFFAAFGYESGLIRFDLAGDAHDFGSHRQLQVQLDRHRLAQEQQVAILNMPAVFAEVNRDPVRSAQLGQHGSRDWVRLIGLARLPESRDVVDVNAKFGHGVRGQSRKSEVR